MAKIQTTPEFDISLDTFVTALERLTQDYNAEHYAETVKYMITEIDVSRGQKYAKVWRMRNMLNEDTPPTRDTIHAFVDMVTGDIFKPASLNKPAKHARGNIFSDTNGMEAISFDGHVRYMR